MVRRLDNLSLFRVETAVMSLNIQIAMQLYGEGQLHATGPYMHLTRATANAHQHYCIAIQHGQNRWQHTVRCAAHTHNMCGDINVVHLRGGISEDAAIKLKMHGRCKVHGGFLH